MWISRLFANVVPGGFGSRVTGPKLKERLGGLAYALTGVAHFTELLSNHGRFRAEGFAWEGDFVAFAIGNGPASWRWCTALSQRSDRRRLVRLDHRTCDGWPCFIWHTFAELLRDGAAGIQDSLVTTRSAWIAYDSESEINVNLDGEPLVVKVFRSKYGSDKRISVRRVRHPRPLYAAYTPTELASRRRWAAMAAAYKHHFATSSK